MNAGLRGFFMSDRKSEDGAALIIVLSILVLLTALAVAFITSTKNALNATVQYAAGQEVHALSETATDLVMGQIREATLSGIDGQGRATHAWASQPGALRVWDNEGDFVQLYKLYSASKMKEDGLGFLGTEIPSDWREHPDEYVDLNEPVFKGTKWHYPILNPAALGVVDGFSSGQTDNASVNWDTRTSMPVRWLYVNRDGEMSNSLKDDSVGPHRVLDGRRDVQGEHQYGVGHEVESERACKAR